MPFTFKHSHPLAPDSNHEDVAIAFTTAEQEWHDQVEQQVKEQGIPIGKANPVIVSTVIDEDAGALLPVVVVTGTFGPAE